MDLSLHNWMEHLPQGDVYHLLRLLDDSDAEVEVLPLPGPISGPPPTDPNAYCDGSVPFPNFPAVLMASVGFNFSAFLDGYMAAINVNTKTSRPIKK